MPLSMSALHWNMAYMKPTTDILMIDPLPRVVYFRDSVFTERWRPFCPFHDVVPRGQPPTTFDNVDASKDGSSSTSYLEFIKSTREDLTSWLENDKDSEEEPMDIFEALLTVVGTDTETLLDIIMTELDSITRKIMNEALLQEELSSWRNSMSRYTLELEGMRRSLDGFHEFAIDHGASKKAKSKLEHIRSRVKKTLAHSASSYATMRAEMFILDSRRSIAEAELLVNSPSWPLSSSPSPLRPASLVCKSRNSRMLFRYEVSSSLVSSHWLAHMASVFSSVVACYAGPCKD